TLLEDSFHSFAEEDFGFTDPNDDPADGFKEVIITTLPAAGTLKYNDVDVLAGDRIPVASLSALIYRPAANANGTAYSSFTFQVVDDGDLDELSPEDTDPT